MAKTYTNRGKAWESANSWWILLTLLPFAMTSFIGFLYVGSKVKNQRWRVYGFIYLAVFIIAFITTATGIGAAIAFSLWIVTVIHAFKIRPAYLVQLDVLKANEKEIDNQKISKLRQEAEAKFSVTETVKTQPPQPKEAAKLEESTKVQEIKPPLVKNVVPEKTTAEKLDINTASESEIASIPEIGIILAKKVMIKRQEIGGFQSFEQFSQIMGLKEHTVEKLVQRLAFSQAENNETQTQTKSGRVIDF